MSDQDRRRLREIHTFPALVTYLRDELRWPVGQDNFDDLDDITFDWEADELGIDPDQAAKIEYIKQLRPLANGQPQGVFFIKFDTKSLPVVALRRLLSKLVVKKRATARAAERPLWAMRDLVFISSYGQSTERQLSFAYFQESEHTAELPTLKVLGWDDRDTALYLDRVHDRLSDFLTWPNTPQDLPEWRKDWSKAFDLRHGEIVTTAKQLADQLAALARGIRERANQLLRLETERGPLRTLMRGFKKALIHDLTEDQFADMYAQTIAYGLLSARITHPDPVKAETLPDLIPVTNPFLKELMEIFVTAGGKHRGRQNEVHLDFDELGINDVVDLLRSADMDAVLRNFGADDRNEDPVTYFYEDFLNAYDAKERKRRGVYYTPKPVVSYIVRSVHELLQSEFGIEDGLASTITWGEMVKRHEDLTVPSGVSTSSPFVQILDPATGTATFLVSAIEVILATLKKRWSKEGLSERQQLDAWNKYVPEHLLPRLFGYELMMAPYAIAHLKFGLKLFETGYRFDSDGRAQIYLTNSLEPATDARDSQIDALSEALAHEANAVNDIKRTQRFTVVIGNPPYSGISSNMADSMQQMVDAYRFVDGAALNERKVWLQDDYVKFIRAAQLLIDSTGVGVLGYITNHGYLDNPTFRGMRQSVMSTFRRFRVIDLHGNANKKERAPDGSEDKNVFDIRQGVAICLGSRNSNSAFVKHFDLWGPRQTKYQWLTGTSVLNTNFADLTPHSPFYFLEPQSTDNREEYEVGFKLTEAMPCFGLGFQSSRDHLVVGFDRRELESTINSFTSTQRSDADVRTEFFPGKKVADYAAGDTRQWSLSEARRQLRADTNWRERIRPCLYRPFDFRVILYDKRMVDWPRPEVLGHMLHTNLCLLANRQSKEDFAALCSNTIAERKIAAVYDGSSSFPLYLYSDNDGLNLSTTRQPNFSPSFLRALATRLGVEQARPHGVPVGLTPEDIFFYVYALFYSPIYRARYADFLRIEFARVPLTGSMELFRVLARFGGELTALHLLESPRLEQLRTQIVSTRSFKVEKASWSHDTVWIDKSQSNGFRGVPEDVWNFHIGGYQVCEKWLKDRKGRILSNDDLEHYQKIVVALSETIRIMNDIDEVIETHGGWPEAFKTVGLSRQG